MCITKVKHKHKQHTTTSVTSVDHFEMNTNEPYTTNAAEVATTGNVAYVTAEDVIPATQNVAYGQVPPGTDDYDYL